VRNEDEIEGQEGDDEGSWHALLLQPAINPQDRVEQQQRQTKTEVFHGLFFQACGQSRLIAARSGLIEEPF
jgi:hypothetical protein